MSADDPTARYGLVRPLMGDALVAVHRVHGESAPIVWAQLLSAAGLAGHETTDAALIRVIQAMKDRDPLSRIAARSLLVRIDSYAQLAGDPVG